MLLAARERLNKDKSSEDSGGTVKSTAEMRSDVDPIQVSLYPYEFDNYKHHQTFLYNWMSMHLYI